MRNESSRFVKGKHYSVNTEFKRGHLAWNKGKQCHNKIKIICGNCGIEFEDWSSGKRKYCSRECHGISTRVKLSSEKLKEMYESGLCIPEIAKKFGCSKTLVRKRFFEFGIPIRSVSEAIKLGYKMGARKRMCGKNHPLWRAERTMQAGYVYIFPGIGKRIREHRYIWEQSNGKIPSGCIIHHLNGIKTDNRIENLCMVTRANHSANHAPERTIEPYKKRILELEKKLADKESGSKDFYWINKL